VIGVIVGRAASTVGKVLRQHGCSRLPKPERDPIIRYEREPPERIVTPSSVILLEWRPRRVQFLQAH
jgi:hypothetical protein